MYTISVNGGKADEKVVVLCVQHRHSLRGIGFDDGSQISIDCTAVENEVADNRFQRSELDYLIYNDSLAYADLILNSKLNVLFE